MSLAEDTPVEKGLKESGLGFVGALTGKVPGDIHIDGSNLKWTTPSSNPDGEGKVGFEREITELQKEVLKEAGIPVLS